MCQPTIEGEEQTEAKPFVLAFDQPVDLREIPGSWCAANRLGKVTCWDGCSGRGPSWPKDPTFRELSGFSEVVQLVSDEHSAPWTANRNDTNLCGLARSGGVICARVQASSEEACLYVQPVQPMPSLRDAVQLAGSNGRVCARRASGHIACWGQRETPLGDGKALFHPQPIQIEIAPSELR